LDTSSSRVVGEEDEGQKNSSPNDRATGTLRFVGRGDIPRGERR